MHADWNRMMTTCFNGASNIAQAGGMACLQVRQPRTCCAALCTLCLRRVMARALLLHKLCA